MNKPMTVNAYYYKALPSDGRLSIKLPKALHDDAKAKANAEGITLSAVIKICSLITSTTVSEFLTA